MLPPSQCVSKSVEHRVSFTTTLRFGELFTGASILSLCCVCVETVIHGHESPGSASSARWRESSSGGQPELHPS